MKTLTLWQPWASLIAVWAKTIETRSWKTSYRGQLAIHAAARPVGDMPHETHKAALRILHDFSTLPLGAIVAVCELVECVPVEDVWLELKDMDDEQWFGDYSAGRFAWILSDIKAFDKPVRVKGAQGLWNWAEIGLE